MEHGRYPEVKDAVKYGSGLVLMLDHEMNVKLALQFWVRWGELGSCSKAQIGTQSLRDKKCFCPAEVQ